MFLICHPRRMPLPDGHAGWIEEEVHALCGATQRGACGAVVGYLVAAWAVDLDVANGILPGYIMGLYFFTGYALRLQVTPCFLLCRPRRLYFSIL